MRNHPLLGPLLGIIGAIALFVVSLMTWYQVDLSKISVGAKFAAQYAKQADLATSANAWEPWGFGSDIVMLAVIVGAIGLGVMLASGGTRSVGLAAALLAVGVVGTLLILLHILSGPQPTEIVDVQPISWLGALSAIVIMVGGYLSFDYAQHSAPLQPQKATQAKAKTARAQQRSPRPAPQPDRGGHWDDADFD